MTFTGTIAVTGSTGGLGIALVEALSEGGFVVRATGRSTRHHARIAATGAEFIQGDLLDPRFAEALVDGCAAVIHCAALSSAWGRREDFDRANIEATQRLLDAAEQASPSRFLYISSPSIYAAMADRTNLTEQDAPTEPPLSDYARTKLAAERCVLDRNRPAFLTTAIRPRAIVGPDDMVLLPRLIELAQRPRIPLPRAGQALIELTDIRDVCTAIIGALTHIEAVAGKALNISGGDPKPVHAITQAVCDALEVSPKLVSVPLPIAKILASLAEMTSSRNAQNEPVLTRYKLATLAYSQSFDLRRARETIGYRPRHDALATLCAVARERMR